MKEYIAPLNDLLNEIAINEKKFRKRFFYSLALPIILALILLGVFSYQIYKARIEINEAQQTIINLTQERDKLNQEISDKNQEISDKNQEISDQEKLLSELTENKKSLSQSVEVIESRLKKNLNWKKTDVLVKNQTKIRDSQFAVERIKDLFKTHSKEINLDIFIKYDWKKRDREVIRNLLRKCVLLNTAHNEDTYGSTVPTNKISFGKTTTLSEVKLIAYLFIWAGLDIKKIEPLSYKSHRIEISGENGLNDFESVTLEQIDNAKSLDEIITLNSMQQ
jgi:cell division protein FtsL